VDIDAEQHPFRLASVQGEGAEERAVHLVRLGQLTPDLPGAGVQGQPAQEHDTSRTRGRPSVSSHSVRTWRTVKRLWATPGTKALRPR
jgi:hypothetical protein